jgi:hypothetical protein
MPLWMRSTYPPILAIMMVRYTPTTTVANIITIFRIMYFKTRETVLKNPLRTDVLISVWMGRDASAILHSLSNKPCIDRWGQESTYASLSPPPPKTILSGVDGYSEINSIASMLGILTLSETTAISILFEPTFNKADCSFVKTILYNPSSTN